MISNHKKVQSLQISKNEDTLKTPFVPNNYLYLDDTEPQIKDMVRQMKKLKSNGIKHLLQEQQDTIEIIKHSQSMQSDEVDVSTVSNA